MKFWKCLVLGLLGGMMLFHFAAIAYIRGNHYELTSADYYARELKHQNLLDRLAAGNQFAWHLSVHPDRNHLSLRVRDTKGLHLELDEVKVSLYRPNASREDQVIALHGDVDGLLEAECPTLSSGRWNVLIEATWQGTAVAYQEERTLP